MLTDLQSQLRQQSATIVQLQNRVEKAEMNAKALSEKLERAMAENAQLKTDIATKTAEVEDRLHRFNNQELQDTYALQDRTGTANQLAVKEKELEDQRADIDKL